MTMSLSSTSIPKWYYNQINSGQPPGAISEDPWPPDALTQEAMAAEDFSPWAAQLSNSSLTVEGNNSSESLEILISGASGMNHSLWKGSQIHMGMDLQLFPEWIVGVWTGVLVMLMVVGVIGNVLVPIVVMRTRDLRSSTNLLLVNLAAADLLVLLVSLPTALTELHSRPETWVLGQHMCKLVPFVEYCVSHASVLTILVISFERYYAICRPLRASYTCTKMRACTCILTIWAAAVVLSCPMLVLSWHGMVNYKDGSRVLVCITDLTTFWACLYINVVTAVFFFVPLALLVFLYLIIGRSLMQDSTSPALHQHKIDLPNMKARKQVVVMLATVTIFFFMSLFPFRVFTLWIVWNPKEDIESVGPLKFYCMLYGARVLLFANSAFNPILYNLTSTKFREAFLKLLSNDKRRQLSRQSTFNTTGTSMSNGRSGSSRTLPTDINSVKRVDVNLFEKRSSFDNAVPPRPNMARYGRQSSFAGTYTYSSISGNSPYHTSRLGNRSKGSSFDSPVENRKGNYEGKSSAGESNRLLENELQVFNQIQEGKSSTKGCLRASIQRRDQEKIAAEMEKLLSDGEGSSDKPNSAKFSSTPKSSLKVKKDHKITLPKERTQGKWESDGETSFNDPEDIRENEASFVEEDNEISVKKENLKTVLFCESLSTKISLV